MSDESSSSRKRDQPDVLYTPEKLVDMRRILLRNLMTPCLNSGSLPQIHHMECGEWFLWLNSSEQLALALRQKMHAISIIVFEQAIQKVMNFHENSEKYSHTKLQEIASSLQADADRLEKSAERAHKEFMETLSSCVQTILGLCDPGGEMHTPTSAPPPSNRQQIDAGFAQASAAIAEAAETVSSSI